MKLNIWVILDGKQGHENQTKALLFSLRKLADLKVKFFFASGLLINLWNILIKRNKQLSSPDLIIGAGHNTHYDILLKKLMYGGRSIVIMKPTIPTLFFDLSIIPKHDHIFYKKKIFQTNGPLNNIVNQKKHNNIKGLILVGGPSKHYIWDDAYIIKSIQEIFKKNNKINFIVGTSRRTPLNFYMLWEKTFSRKIKIYKPDEVSENWLSREIEKSKYSWVTQDSISMTYELINAGTHLTCIDLQEKTKKFSAIYKNLYDERKLNFLSKKNKSLLIENSSISEADKCAKYIYNKFIK